MMDPLLDIVSGLPTTIALAVISLGAGMVLAIPLLFMRRSRLAPLRTIAVTIITIWRSIPPIVWLFLIFFGLPDAGLVLTPFEAGAIGLGLISSAYFAEMYRGGIMAVDRGQWEAGAALGLTSVDVHRLLIGPQALRVALPSMATYVIITLKDTSLAYAIGVQEVLFRTNHQIVDGTSSPLLLLGFAGALYLVLSFAIAYGSRRLERRLTAKVVR